MSLLTLFGNAFSVLWAASYILFNILLIVSIRITYKLEQREGGGGNGVGKERKKGQKIIQGFACVEYLHWFPMVSLQRDYDFLKKATVDVLNRSSHEKFWVVGLDSGPPTLVSVTSSTDGFMNLRCGSYLL